MRRLRPKTQPQSNVMPFKSTYLANRTTSLFVPRTSLLVAIASMTKQDGAFQTSASTCCTLLLMDLQDGKWTREEKMSASLRDTSEPGTWCFVFSKLNGICLLSLCLQPVILLSFEDRLLWFPDTINIGRAFLSFCSNLLSVGRWS